jgi:hypothetical protein
VGYRDRIDLLPRIGDTWVAVDDDDADEDGEGDDADDEADDILI